MSLMPRVTIAMATIAGAAALACAALAQGVAPGGPIAGSTAIGSGLGGGGPGGTGPSWPNGTNQAPQPVIPSVPPGGTALPSSSVGGISPSTSSTYYQPSTRPARRPPSIVPLDLPSQAPADVALLRGCWRTDVFVYESHTGITTWCFNDRGTGRVLYSRIDKPDYACNAMAQARVAGQGIVLHSLETTCSDGRALPLGDLDCRQGSERAQCSGSLPTQGPGETWRVGLYRVQR